jgi:starch-binding outer membrane protein, SusD/RagB family
MTMYKNRLRFVASLALALVLAVGLTGCDMLDNALSVEAPALVDASDMSEPGAAPLLVSGTISDFECALGAYIEAGGVLGNELRDASVTAARFDRDRRTILETSPYGVNSCTGNPAGIYRPLSTAIWTSGNALELLKSWTDQEVENRQSLIAQASAYSGYSHVLMGEGFCSSVITPEGPEVQPQAIFQAAEARFTEAIAAADAAGNTDIRNMALLGRARARLNLGNGGGAAADARAVLTSNPQYVKSATASSVSSRRYNGVGNRFFLGGLTVDPSYRDLTVEGVPDTRVRVIDTGTDGHDNATRVYIVAKLGETRTADLRNVPQPIGSWREAHLIIAEAEGGQEAVNRVNILRNHHGLPTYTGGTSPAEIQALIIQERARELYLEGHHLNDLRRFNLPNTPEAGAQYRQGGFYGNATCFPLPRVEKDNNPNFR